MEFTRTEVIPDFPESLMRICGVFGIPVCVHTENGLDDDHNAYQDMRVTLDLDDVDGDQSPSVVESALTACHEYTAQFKGQVPYFQSWSMDDVDGWVEEWREEMGRRFPQVRFC